MKNRILLLATCLSLLLLTTRTAAQNLCNIHDTTDCVVDLDVVGNPFSGYRLKPVLGEVHHDSLRFRIYQCDVFGDTVRRIVVTKEKWHNAPVDLMVTDSMVIKHESHLEPGDGGYRIRAVTPREYRELSANGKIWGEYFEIWINKASEQRPGHDLIEMTCYPDKWYNSVSNKRRSLELMYYIDPSDGRKYMTVAVNRVQHMAEYDHCFTNGRYNCRMIGVSGEDEKRWLRQSQKQYPWLHLE